MKLNKELRNILNTPSYIEPLPDQEYIAELNKIIKAVKNMDKNNVNQEYRANFKKIIDKIIYYSRLKGLC